MKFLVLLALLFGVLHAQIKVVSTDWTAAEILKFIGYEPSAVGDKNSYKIWVGEPDLGEDVVDLGLRMQPNIERLIKLDPDIVIVPSFFSFNITALAKHLSNTKIIVIDAYKSGNLEENLKEATLEISKLVNKENEAKNLLDGNDKFFNSLSAKVTNLKDDTFAVIQFIDSKRVRIYGTNSIYGITLSKLGLKNALSNEFETNLWDIATIPVTSLFKLPKNTKAIIIKPNPINLKEQIKFNSLFASLDMFKDYVELEPVWGAGAYLSMQKFAKALISLLGDKQ
ncbi:ABC transporter substrate-binding protein [Campylobacter sp. RM9344]|uniref:ABC transporter substrate-binding protein n=1 Tax=Campylobacter californiensis TaxID=1032243 RepID=A0AAW3ZY67_9BACT|nr:MULTISPECIES: ABC transporter substrate-binding protein [unclassified Campylobacter]MBE2984997.1 ABC transporter substrate-binding protein [Campylobacter sp. RM6883]MBE2995193.1 ABC transporter substrate-binding protein [Campylobacter sp. RM6913]MBE3029551.1 ABC transporter substrate-binding protein [Campylobacter sp. RM9344]MBE3608185.1 ABC transporter substrate-binding protein [Campylobacter sp. RM9337]QCD51644.1 ferric siderophore ABC transporter, periplasmic substrate-binding protein [C